MDILYFLIGIFILVGLLLLIVGTISLYVWTYKDCKLRGENPIVWILIMIFLSNVIGFIIYLFVRKKKIFLCDHCNSIIDEKDSYCTVCGMSTDNIVNDNDNNKINKKKIRNKHNKYFIVVIITYILGIISIFIAFSIVFIHLFIYSEVESVDIHNYIQEYDNIDSDYEASYINETKMFIKDPATNNLYIDLYYEEILDFEENEVFLTVSQGDKVLTSNIYDIENVMPLNYFDKGDLNVKLEIYNTIKVKSQIYIN